MGCDIHLHTEVKIEGKWRHWGNPGIDRWYVLFEKMAGVRGDIENAIVAPKGLPEDITFETKFDYENYGGGMHSMSWLSVEEIDEVYKWYDKNKMKGMFIIELDLHIGFILGNGWNDIQEDNGIEDVRWVFWFDN